MSERAQLHGFRHLGAHGHTYVVARMAGAAVARAVGAGRPSSRDTEREEPEVKVGPQLGAALLLGVSRALGGVSDAPAATRGRAAGKSSARDLRLDFLRGFCVVAMLVDHYGGASWLYALTGGNRFYASAAEGFVFLSGMVFGLVYRAEIARRGLWSATRKALRRALTLYLVNVALTLAFVSVSHWLGMPWDQGFQVGDPRTFVWRVVTLRQTYALVDVMVLYTFLVAVSPAALWLLNRGHTGVLLVGSWAAWAAYQFAPQPLSRLPWPIANNDVFHLVAWQVVFISGLAIGYHRRAVAERLAWAVRWPALAALSLSLLALVWLHKAGEAALAMCLPRAAQAQALAALGDKGAVGPLRVITSAVAFALAFALVTQLWEPLRRALGWLLVPLGQRSLQAYCAHLFLIAFASHALGYVDGYDPDVISVNTLLQAALAVALWLIVSRRLAPRGRLVPVAGSVGVLGLALALGGSSPVVDAVLAAGPAVAVQRVPAARPSPPELPRVDFFSAAMGRPMNTFVYLPLGYRSSDACYPVLYLLHGSGGSNTEWPGYGVTLAADDLIASGQIQPMIIVMPQGDQDYWFNHADGGPRWGDYVWQDLVGYVDSTYRTLPTPSKRAIGGLSMGGFGALNLAIQHPDVFGAGGAHSPALPVDDGNLKEFFGDSSYFRQHDPFFLYRDAAAASRLKLWIDVSTGDPRLPRVQAFHDQLAAEGVPHEWHALPGNHDGVYWGAHARDYLRFYDAALRG